jgi:hypothetical protein
MGASEKIGVVAAREARSARELVCWASFARSCAVSHPAVVGICVTTAVTVTVAGSALGYAVFLASGLLAGLGTAWVIARTTSGPLWLFAGAILVTTASLAAPAVVILLIFAVAGAGN